MSSIAIIGAGNGGQAFAGYLAIQGHEVRIFDVVQDTIDQLNEKGGITIEGKSDVTGFGKLALASTDMGAVLRGAEIVLVILPSIYTASIAEKMSPYLEDGQYVMINPNACLGVVEFRHVLNQCGCQAKITLACSATLLFACRAKEPGHVVISGQKISFSAAALPASDNEKAAAVFNKLFPQWSFGDDVIRVALDNLNAMVHPSPSILNTGRIESGVDFEYYLDFTPSQGAFVDALDRERMAIAKAYDEPNVRSLVDEYLNMYETSGTNTYEVLTNCKGYDGIMGQKTLRTRYLLEDIPYSLVALQSLGRLAGVPTPNMDAIITIARTMVPEIAEGRTLKSLGLANASKEDFIKLCRG